MDRIILWQRIEVARNEIFKDINVILSNKSQFDKDIIEQAEELKKFLSNDNRLKENIDNDEIYRFLDRASKIMKEAVNESEGEKEI